MQEALWQEDYTVIKQETDVTCVNVKVTPAICFYIYTLFKQVTAEFINQFLTCIGKMICLKGNFTIIITIKMFSKESGQ